MVIKSWVSYPELSTSLSLFSFSFSLPSSWPCVCDWLSKIASRIPVYVGWTNKHAWCSREILYKILGKTGLLSSLYIDLHFFIQKWDWRRLTSCKSAYTVLQLRLLTLVVVAEEVEVVVLVVPVYKDIKSISLKSIPLKILKARE